ncbi:MAG: hypothetical protein HY013_20095, partial [Candidatus Solibacter usitatus]|nr:hypothetical protein [Candidatus Solibacter usitatus]
QRSRRETFEFQAPKASLEARARLYYRLVSEQAAKIAAIQPSPPIEVAADQILIQPDGRVAKIP